jgi:hypothetical protein
MASTTSATASATGNSLQYAWDGGHGRWVIFVSLTCSLKVAYCSVSEDPHSLPRPPIGYAISWIPPSETDEQALEKASHSEVYFVLRGSNGVKHELDDELSSESVAKKPKTDDYLATEPKPDTHKKRRL